MNILFVGADTVAEHNCEEWRCAIPFRALRRAGVACEYIHMEQWLSELDDPFTEKADLVIFQRNIFAQAQGKLLYWRGKGKPIVVDLDDAYEIMHHDTGSPAADFWMLGKQPDENGNMVILQPHPREVLKTGVKLAGAVSSPSKVILDDWKPRGVKTYWLPNYLEVGIYKRSNPYRMPGKIMIGGGGSMGHVKSWADSGVTEALNKLCREDKRIMVMFTGDERVLQKMRFPPSQRVNLSWVPYSLYYQNLSRFDIGIIPLAGEYDRRRSWIKPAEYSIMGIPWIGSDYEPNRDVNGGRLVENTEQAWYEALRDYVSRVEELTAKAMQERVDRLNEFDIDIHLPRLIDTYEMIISEANND